MIIFDKSQINRQTERNLVYLLKNPIEESRRVSVYQITIGLNMPQFSKLNLIENFDGKYHPSVDPLSETKYIDSIIDLVCKNRYLHKKKITRISQTVSDLGITNVLLKILVLRFLSEGKDEKIVLWATGNLGLIFKEFFGKIGPFDADYLDLGYFTYKTNMLYINNTHKLKFGLNGLTPTMLLIAISVPDHVHIPNTLVNSGGVIIRFKYR